MASCERFIDLICQSLDGSLALEDQQALQQHLEECPECRQLSQELSEIRLELHSWEEQEVPEGFAEGVMSRIRAEEQKPKIVPIWKHPQFKMFGSIAACALICVGIWRVGTPNMTEDMAFSTETATPAAETPIQFQYSASASTTTADEVPRMAQAPTEAAALSPAALPESKSASPVQDCTSYSSVIRSENGSLPSEELLLQTVHNTLGIVPGELLLMDVIPEAIASSAVCYTTENGFLLFVLEETPDAGLMQDCKASALLALTYGDGPSIFVTWN